MAFVDLDFDTFFSVLPFQLSGGQMRRVAIAGVVAMEPDYLIMDEPSAGLDPVSRDNIFSADENLRSAKWVSFSLPIPWRKRPSTPAASLS